MYPKSTISLRLLVLTLLLHVVRYASGTTKVGTMLTLVISPFAFFALFLLTSRFPFHCQVVGYSPTDGTGITYESGLPKTIPISFDTDFVVDQSNKGVGSTYMEWSLSEDSGNNLYNAVDQNNDLAFDQTSAGTGRVATFTLNPTGNGPAVGSTVVVTLHLSLKYVNTDSVTLLMHSRVFSVTLSILGAENSHPLVSSRVSTTTFSPLSTDQSNNSEVTSPAPPGLALQQSGGSVTFPNPIVLAVDANDASYNVWFDSTVSVDIRDGAQVTDRLVYTWPASMVSASVTSQTSGVSSLAVTLSSVPVSLYNQETIYAFLSVKFLKTEGDRRALRGAEYPRGMLPLFLK